MRNIKVIIIHYIDHTHKKHINMFSVTGTIIKKSLIHSFHK